MATNSPYPPFGDAHRGSPYPQDASFARLEYHPQSQSPTDPRRKRAPQQQQQMSPPKATPVPLPPQVGGAAAAAAVMAAQMIGGGGDRSGQFGVLAPTEAGVVQARTGGKLPVRMVVDPPDLHAWRQKLFDVDETIVLTQEEFETYFPHVDNVYSHRSTQKYKRKPFISHYWDCRMKGRPPGTPKTDDPSKKRRRRSARERDLCDVKIKITEYFPGSEAYYQTENATTIVPPPGLLEGQKFWTIQRVNGNGGNGKGDGVAGPHKHSLERSDEIKKNSVQRWLATQDKETKAVHPARKASGQALATAKRRAKDADLKFYGACWCPFSQRVWMALQAKGLPYQYVETDPYKKGSSSVLEVNPRGKVPAIKHGEWSCGESSIILEYLEDLNARVPLLPTDPKARATCRLWIDHINTQIVPAFYALLQNQDLGLQPRLVENLQASITAIVAAAHQDGPFFLGQVISLVDVHLIPFAQRLRTVLAPRRGFPLGEGSVLPGHPLRWRWVSWMAAMDAEESVLATTSGGELYADTADALMRSYV